MAEGHYPDEAHPGDEKGPFYEDDPRAHMNRFGIALLRALNEAPQQDGMQITFWADVVRKNPGGIKEYKVSINPGS